MIPLRVIPDEGDPIDIDVTSRDVLRWERSGRGKTLKSFEQNPTMAAMYELAHTHLLRTKQFAGDLDELMATVDIEELADEAEEGEGSADPTQ